MQSKETLKGSIIEKEIFQHLKSNERSLLPEYSKRYKTYIDAILALRNAWLKQQEKAFLKAKNTDIGLEDLIRHPEK